MKKLLAGLVVFLSLWTGAFAMDLVVCGGIDVPTYNYKDANEIHTSIGGYCGCYLMMINGVGIGGSMDIAFSAKAYDQATKESKSIGFDYASVDCFAGLTYSPLCNNKQAFILTGGLMATMYSKKKDYEIYHLGVAMDATYNYYIYDGLGLDFGIQASYFFLENSIAGSTEKTRVLKGVYKVIPRIGISLLIDNVN